MILFPLVSWLLLLTYNEASFTRKFSAAGDSDHQRAAEPDTSVNSGRIGPVYVILRGCTGWPILFLTALCVVFTSMELSCNTTHNLRTREALVLEESCFM